MSSKNKTQVLIGGKIYTLSGYESEDYLQKVATYLNNKISEMKGLESYRRLSQDNKSLLLNLNVADDYFKLKKQADGLENEIAQKDKEIYEIKHELITEQIRLESAQKAMESLQDETNEYQKRIVQLETQIEAMKESKK